MVTDIDDDDEDGETLSPERISLASFARGQLVYAKSEPMVGVEVGLTIDIPLGSVITIGRGEASTVRIPYPRLSRQHARFLTGAKGWCIQDMDSTNGVYVNGKRVVSAWLSDGDEVRLAALPFRFAILPGQDG